MGTTLQNGVYLPNEGERNCYAGLKTNWEILDQKVADVTALQQAVAGALHREIVASLPTTDIDPNTIYMILSGTSATENVYNEYMYVNNAWELIGTSATDLTNYYTKGDVDGLLLLKANASDLTSHTGDTTIHVTTADKNKWNNVVSQAFVFRYSSTALVASSTNSNALLDNTDNLKVGDKVIDSSGVLFSITAIDTANSTFTIGTALIDLAQDSDVVHKSGNETVSGIKTFTDSIQLKSNVAEYGITGGNIQFYLMDKNSVGLSKINQGVYNNGTSYITLQLYGKDSNNQTVTNSITYQYSSSFNNTYLLPIDNSVWLGSIGNRFGKIYGIQYYYGSNNVEFSTKFVTADTAQTISGTKTFTDLLIYNSDTTAYASYLTLRNQRNARGSSETGVQGIQYLDKNGKTLTMLESRVISNGNTGFNIICYNTDGNNQSVSDGVSVIKSPTTTTLAPTTDNAVTCGRTLAKWSDVQTYKVNALEPSSLSLPSGNVSDVIDISSYITDLSGNVNNYTAPANGWISIAVIGSFIAIVSSRWSDSRLRESSGNVRMLYPVLKNETVSISIAGTTLAYARFIPCQGNV